MKSHSSVLRPTHSAILRLVAFMLIALAWCGRAFCGPIHDEAALGNLAKVQSLLKSQPDLVFSRNQYGETPLHLAAQTGHKDVVELLLAYKADANARSLRGWTPLHFAAANGHRDVVALLLAKNADVNARTDRGETPLCLALQARYAEVAELLRQHGGNE